VGGSRRKKASKKEGEMGEKAVSWTRSVAVPRQIIKENCKQWKEEGKRGGRRGMTVRKMEKRTSGRGKRHVSDVGRIMEEEGKGTSMGLGVDKV
jgi:hypothetical protein